MREWLIAPDTVPQSIPESVQTITNLARGENAAWRGAAWDVRAERMDRPTTVNTRLHLQHARISAVTAASSTFTREFMTLRTPVIEMGVI